MKYKLTEYDSDKCKLTIYEDTTTSSMIYNTLDYLLSYLKRKYKTLSDNDIKNIEYKINEVENHIYFNISETISFCIDKIYDNIEV